MSNSLIDEINDLYKRSNCLAVLYYNKTGHISFDIAFNFDAEDMMGSFENFENLKLEIKDSVMASLNDSIDFENAIINDELVVLHFITLIFCLNTVTVRMADNIELEFIPGDKNANRELASFFLKTYEDGENVKAIFDKMKQKGD